MSARGFGSLISAGAVAGAALGFYLVSLRVASERAALEGVETKIALTQRDIRLLQTELGTRGRLAQLERWNVRFIRLSAPTADQFVDGGFQLATLVKPQPRPIVDAPLVLASAPIAQVTPPVDGVSAAPPSRPVNEYVHVASYTAPQPPSAASRPVTPPSSTTVTVRSEMGQAVKKTRATKPVKTATADPLAPLSPAKPKAKGEHPAATSAKPPKDSVTD